MSSRKSLTVEAEASSVAAPQRMTLTTAMPENASDPEVPLSLGRAVSDDATGNQRTRTVRGVHFRKKNTEGDFVWMEKQDEYQNTLFVINENFLDSLDENEAGGGTAKLRPFVWRYVAVPRAAGIPTGWSVASGGFQEMDFYTRKAMDASIDRIKIILRDNPQYTDIVFSCDANNNKKIGTNIFKLPDACINYISAKLFELQFFDAADFHKTHEDVDKVERLLTNHALLYYENARLKDEIRVLKSKLGQTVGFKRLRR
jgi:hypothetical protein